MACPWFGLAASAGSKSSAGSMDRNSWKLSAVTLALDIVTSFMAEPQASRKIDAAAPDVLWIGLSTPKQERWMYEHRDKIGVPVMLGVGAAFDLNTNRLKQAPRWMRENGLEWFFRLLAEPRRLWRRYLVFGSHFVFNVCLEFLGLKQFE
jgi:exopolysaccharide biosynthesis WecB/TagA/CpsF family protein